MASSTSTRGAPNGAAPPGGPPAAAAAWPGTAGAEAAPRLGPPPRPRRRAVWAAGLALVCAGAAVSAAVTMAAGDRVAVLSVTRPVPAGQEITAADLGEARVAADPRLAPIPAEERRRVVGRVAGVDLVPGTLLTGGQLSTVAVPASGQAVVGVPLRPGQLPARPLRPGDNVRLVETADPAAAGAVPRTAAAALARSAVVADAGPAGADGTVVVDVVLGERDALAVAGAAAAGRVSLVLLPRVG